MSNQKYHIAMRLLHWLMAIIIICLLGMGLYMSGLDNSVSYKRTLYGVHKSFGALILILIFFRAIIRVSTTVPPLPQSMSIAIRRFAFSTHYLLYLLMILMPLSGYLMSNYFGHGVSLFSISLPNLVSKDPVLGGICAATHEFLGFTFIFIIALHLSGVIKHRFFDRKEHNILPRMI